MVLRDGNSLNRGKAILLPCIVVAVMQGKTQLFAKQEQILLNYLYYRKLEPQVEIAHKVQ